MAVHYATLAFPDEPVGVRRALDVAFNYGSIEGDHHRAWVIDQMVRDLAGDKYAEFVKAYNDGEDGPNSYEWDEGIAP